jgi:hypothetical protein
VNEKVQVFFKRADLAILILTRTSQASHIPRWRSYHTWLEQRIPRLVGKDQGGLHQKVVQLTSVTEHSGPTRIADTLEAAVAVAVPTPGEGDALLAKLSGPSFQRNIEKSFKFFKSGIILPSNFTVTSERLRAVSMDAFPAVDLADGDCAQLGLVRVSW